MNITTECREIKKAELENGSRSLVDEASGGLVAGCLEWATEVLASEPSRLKEGRKLGVNIRFALSNEWKNRRFSGLIDFVVIL